MATGGHAKDLINILGDVKARVQDKLGIVDFPLPTFIIVGKQSVGKSRLCEAFAGETFNFISGTLGSRRPTYLEFRNVSTHKQSRWFVKDLTDNQWKEYPVAEVMKIVGEAHNSLGETCSDKPVYVRVESPSCVDMSIVDLPGFRDFASDPAKQALGDKIHEMVYSFMRDPKNVMLCVEQASDAANMSTLAKCKEMDPSFQRTILVRNKLDKYYDDLTDSNVNQWVEGMGDLGSNLVRFALTLPWWPDGSTPTQSFADMRTEKAKEDVSILTKKSLREKYMSSIGFINFQAFMENKIQQMFAAAINPVLANLRALKDTAEKEAKELETEYIETDPNRILSTTRDCGTSFATALVHVMEGVLRLTQKRMTLEIELREFNSYHQALGEQHFDLLPSSDFSGLDDYVEYLRNEIQVGAFDVEINGGAQFRRLMTEVEIFLRFSEIATETKKRDVIQARGVSMTQLTWRDVVVKVLSNEAHQPLQRRVLYVGERIKWFFEQQKEAVLEFMDTLEGTPAANMFSPLYPKHVKLIKQNQMIQHLVFKTYDDACERQLHAFLDLFDNMLTSTFSNPWVFLKGATPLSEGGELEDAVLPSFDDTKERIPKEIENRSKIEGVLSKWLQEIPTEPGKIDEAVDKVQQLVLKTYSFIRSQVCDQVELFAESFFKLPMLRRLEEDMSMIELSEADKQNYETRRNRLGTMSAAKREALKEVDYCIESLNTFKLKIEADSFRPMA